MLLRIIENNPHFPLSITDWSGFFKPLSYLLTFTVKFSPPIEDALTYNIIALIQFGESQAWFKKWFEARQAHKTPVWIELFSQVSNNADLISDLRKVTKWRNFCAHNAFAHEFLNRTSKSNFTPHKVEDVETVVQFCANLVERLGNEMSPIRTAHKALVGESQANSSSSGT